MLAAVTRHRTRLRLRWLKEDGVPAGKHGRMSKRILIIQGHPDNSQPHFCHALAAAYADAARDGNHEVQMIDVAGLEFPWLRSRQAWDSGETPAALLPAQEAIQWAEHLVFFFPLWLGGMPAVLKAFLEQVARPGFALSHAEPGGFPKKLLSGRSARLVVTMGMPALVYRWYFRAHSVKALERNILGFVGIAPVHETLIGQVEGMKLAEREAWLSKLSALGRKAA
jgi:putative NADPH-quinone reductase